MEAPTYTRPSATGLRPAARREQVMRRCGRPAARSGSRWRVVPGTNRFPYWSRVRLEPGDDAAGPSNPDDAGMITTGIEVETLTQAVNHVEPSQPREGGRVRKPGFGSAEQRFHVGHLVIFPAPVVGYLRPAAVGAA